MSKLARFGRLTQQLISKPVRPKLRLSTFLSIVVMCAILFAWWRDHRELKRQIYDLTIDVRTRHDAELGWLKQEIATFVKRHQGKLIEDSPWSMSIDLRDTMVGNSELNKIRVPMKRFDFLQLSVPLELRIYGCRVTKAYATELQQEMPHWKIITEDLERPPPS